MSATPSPAPRRLLHVGCGLPHPAKLPLGWLPPGPWEEVRLDIDPAVEPDIVASITDMRAVPEASFDAVWSAHNLEHLYPHEVPLALAEFRRVLRPEGFVLLTLPDLQQVAVLVAADRLTEPAYLSPAGPISALDMLYGHGAAIAQGNHFMGHRGGFTARSLQQALEAAGFPLVRVARDERFALWATAHKSAPALVA
ncbi:class I SAM-dependent methyltransferase [Siccirubricoccus sp. KC 17139]|uniref:Class I SAM-dependent methyltransferase n=1 Tax=Siccirubricoccus soli TaxID=2899147 RepID=A0ABT1D0J4_9PROT|nr:methyltransferase domain-containing protein [Siccirubricoccus soli]MCO6415431.1 class I SAM-dependent methyltransferase [Siccirubricoccus soli]MCP2681563.1 class I SAM-dependent methyltransferase [Siccirubricoccus soli]